jgi:acyl carrier protein
MVVGLEVILGDSLIMKESYLIAVIEVIRDVGGVVNLEPDQDFYDAGVTSVQALPLLLELETRFEVAIPDERFMTARTARSLCEVVQRIKEA